MSAIADIERGAVLSDDEVYRYELHRCWDPRVPSVLWIMLNPSKADAEDDDPTIRRCIGFAKTWGYGGIVVCNLFAFRATKPEKLIGATDPIGPENDAHLFEAARNRRVIAAWGTSVPTYWRHRPAAIAAQLRQAGVDLHHVGLTKDGHPRHPLYLRGDTQPSRWSA